MVLIILQQQFDVLCLNTMQATVGGSAAFFAAIMIFGAFFLLEYVTAVLCITYAEVTTTHEDFAESRADCGQIMLQIELLEGAHRPRGDGQQPDNDRELQHHEHTDNQVGSETMNSPQVKTGQGDNGVTTPLRTPKRNMTADDFRPAVPSGFADRLWLYKKRLRNWSHRVPKTRDVDSYPFLNMYLEINMEAVDRIKARVRETSAQDSKVVTFLRVGYDLTSYFFAAAIMYPAAPSEMFGAKGWHGSDFVGKVSIWEWGMTALSVIEVANQIVLSSVRIQSRENGVEPPESQSYDQMSWMIWCLFAGDLVIKLIAFKRPLRYFHSSLNQLDAITTTLQFFGMITWNHPNLAGFRVARWISVLALARNLSSFNKLIERCFGSLSDAVIAICMIFFFVCLTSCFGQQVFAGSKWEDFSRPYFGSFYLSLVSVIEFSSNDGLLLMLQQGLTAGAQTSVFLLLGTMFVNLLLLRLMIPFMLLNCEETDMFKIRYQIFFNRVLGGNDLIWENTKQHARLLSFFHKYHGDDYDEDELMRRAHEQCEAVENARDASVKVHLPSAKAHMPHIPHVPDSLLHMPSLAGMRHLGKQHDLAGAGTTKVARTKTILGAVEAWHTYGHLENKDEGHVSEVRRFKKAFSHVVHNKCYEPVLALVVIASLYIFGDHLDWKNLEVADKSLRWVLVIFFQIEMILKIWITYGKSLAKTAYYNDPWHILEIFAMLGMYDIVLPYLPYSRGIANLRFLHVIRVLRTLQLFPDVHLAFQRLEAISHDIGHCLSLIVCLLIAFSTLAMTLFGGLFSSCDDNSMAGRAECSGLSYLPVGSTEDESYILRCRAWNAPTENFDSFGNALGTSFALFLNTGWSPVLKAAMSATSASVQPLQYGTGVMALVFVVYQMLAMVLRQLLITVVINSLKVTSGSGLQTDDQKAWYATQRMCGSKCAAYQQSKGSSGSRGWQVAISIKRSWLFRTVVEVTIVINVVTMLFVSYGASTMQEDIIQIINFACLLVYLFEMLTALVADAHIYFLNPWNIFDMIINIVSSLDLYYWFISVQPDVEIISLRSARVLRLVKLASRSPEISILLNFSVKALKSCIGCYLVWVFLMLLFAIPANQMFTGIRQSVYVDPTTLSNFETFQNSVLFLFRIAVQNNFIYAANELNVKYPYCTSGNQTGVWTSDCGHDAVSVWSFFALFTALSRLVIVPFIAGCGKKR